VSVGSTKLQYALKNLRKHWEEARESWSDQVRETFDEKHLRPMETQVAATVRGMDKLAEMMNKMRQECSDRGDRG
jgi:hypothetical protein